MWECLRIARVVQPLTRSCHCQRTSPSFRRRSIVALMIGSQRNGVFLSYARNDAEQFASTLRERLREQIILSTTRR